MPYGTERIERFLLDTRRYRDSPILDSEQRTPRNQYPTQFREITVIILELMKILITTDYTVSENVEDIEICVLLTTKPITITLPSPCKAKTVRVHNYSSYPVQIEGMKVMNEHDFEEFKAREIGKETSIWEFE